MSDQALAVVENAPTVRATRIQVTDPIPVLDTGRFEQMYRIAKIMAMSNLIPESLVAIYEGTGSDRKTIWLSAEAATANCFLIVNQAVGWGMDPFAVAQCASVVKGRVCYEGKLIAAVIDARLGVRLKFEWDDNTGDAAGITVSGLIPGESAPRVVKGTVGQWKTTGANSPWHKQPATQLAYRGSRDWGRLHASAVMLGVYTNDELEDAVARQERRPPPPPMLVETTEARTPPAPTVAAIENKPAVVVAPIADKPKPVEVTSGPQQTAPASTQRRPPAPPSAPASTQRRPPAPPSARPMPISLAFDFAAHKARCIAALDFAKNFDACDGVFAHFAQNRKADLTDEQYMEIRDLVTTRQEAFEPAKPQTNVEWA